MRIHQSVVAFTLVVGVVVAGIVFEPQTQAVARRVVVSGRQVSPLVVNLAGAGENELVAWAIQEQARLDEERAAEVAALTAQEAERLAAQLQAAADRLKAAPGPAVAPVAASPPASADCFGVNQYAAYIYQHESGCNPANPNNPNCEGVGQACPRGKMGCSWTDVPCQLAWFENYALSRYGSWEGAYQFWIGHSWW